MEADPIDKQLLALVATFLHAAPDELSLESASGDLPQWDSFAHANLIMEVERHFRVTFAVEDVLEMVSLGDISAVLRRMSENVSPAQ